MTAKETEVKFESLDLTAEEKEITRGYYEYYRQLIYLLGHLGIKHDISMTDTVQHLLFISKCLLPAIIRERQKQIEESN